MADDVPNNEEECRLLYDGQCIVCLTFAHKAAKETGGRLTKIDAWQASALLDQATAAAMDLDYGIVVEQKGHLYYAGDALHLLAQMKQKSVLLTLFYLPMRSRFLAKIFYPMLVKVRLFILWVGRKPLIKNLSQRKS